MKSSKKEDPTSDQGHKKAFRAFGYGGHCEALHMSMRKKRFWVDPEKREICAQATTPGMSVARRYAVNANLIFKWLEDRKALAPEQKVTFNKREINLETAITGSIELHLCGCCWQWTRTYPECRIRSQKRSGLQKKHSIACD